MMHYETFEPNEMLQPFVKCYWVLESPKEEKPQKQTIVPDGCMEMIFHYGDAYNQYLPNGNKIVQPKCFVIGQLTAPLDIEPTGITGIFSVRFQPDGFFPFATIPIKDMENTAVAMDVLFGEDGVKIGDSICNALNAEERIKLIEAFLEKRLVTSETIDKIIRTTVDTILTGSGQLSVEDLSKRININRRQLERKFATTIGLSPKQLSKTIRLQTTLSLLLSKKWTSLTSLAYEGEYYDQAHFIKDFKEFTGLTPKEFYSDNLTMSALFYGDD